MRTAFQWATRAVKRAVVPWPPQRRGGLDRQAWAVYGIGLY